ncbi:MAG: CRISPR-associated helicase Cas3' [Gemmataceae bacterium]
MDRFFAHSGQKTASEDYADWQRLSTHLQNVAKLAKSLAQQTGNPMLPEAAEAAGWLHDLGKYQPEWQNYLIASAAKSSPKSVPHSIHGAAYSFTELMHIPLTIAIAGHHTGLQDWIGGVEFGGFVGKKTPAALMSTLTERAKLDGTNLPSNLFIPDCEDSESGLRNLEYWTRVLFSTLIDADRLDSAGRGLSDIRLDPTALLDRMREAAPSASANTSVKLNDLRNRVFEACVAAGAEDRGFFELTVPTGGGKTRSGMAFALSHAAKRKLRRVFVVIPYLSIIEQNAEEYRKLFGRDVVLEHHSAVVPDDAPQNEKYQRHLPTENWDVPIVVTTSVQFLETLLAAATRRCRRLHNVAKSVIVFDEAQCLPTHILNPLLDVFRELTANYGCSIVFSTATQPAFRHSPLGLTHGLKPEELKPILPTTLRNELYCDLQRVTFRNETATPWNFDLLVQRLIEAPTLCVLNTRRQAREVWERLKAAVEAKHGKEAVASVRHLSSSLCAEHRMNILGKKGDRDNCSIYARLQAKLPCWVVSTQVIEAGVDIDFPRVFRSLGPLDSIVQASGRCNREGKRERGEVTIFRPADESLPKGLYETATGLASTTLNELGEKLDEIVTNPDVFAKYFDTLYGRAITDSADIQKLRADWKFDTVSKAVKVIDDGGRSVIVPYLKASKWIRRLRRCGTYDLPTLRRLQRYTVNLRENDFVKAKGLGLVSPLFDDNPDGPWVLVDGCYHEDLGVVIADRPLEDFLQ